MFAHRGKAQVQCSVSKVAIISLLEVHQIFFEGMGNNVGVVRIVLRV